MRRCLALLLLLACDPKGREAPPPPPAAPEARMEALRATLEDAVVAWEMEDAEVARALVQAAYEDHFEPLEQALREGDAMGTLRLEYGFGRLRHAMAKEGRRPDVRSQAEALALEVSAAVGHLPAPPSDELTPSD